MKTSKDIYVNTFREEVNCDQCNYFLSLVANLKQHMRFHTGLWMQAMLEEDLLFRICWTWKKQQNTTPRQQCFGLNDLGWFQWKVSGEMKPIRCLLFPCGSRMPPSLQFTTLRFISSRQLCSGRNDLRWLILEKRASCQWFHYTLARLQRIWTDCESWSYLHPPSQFIRFLSPQCLSTPSDHKSQGGARDPRRLVHNYTQSRALVSWSLPRFKPLFSLLPSPALVGFLAF